jgi:hypothetical protein
VLTITRKGDITKLKYQEDVLEVLEEFATLEMIAKVAHGFSSSPNESLHSTQASLYGKSRFTGRPGAYVAAMCISVLKKTCGFAWTAALPAQLHVAISARFIERLIRLDVSSQRNKDYHKLPKVRWQRTKNAFKKEAQGVCGGEGRQAHLPSRDGA